jgi:hypothetical protein
MGFVRKRLWLPAKSFTLGINMEIAILILAVFALVALAAIFSAQKKILQAIKGIRIPEPQKIEIPKIEFPKIELPKIELPKIEIPKIEIPKIELAPAKEAGINAEALQEIAALMRVNQAEFQSGLEAFHKAIDKLLAQIPSGEKELEAQKEFMQKFEAAFARVQEQTAEAIADNSLRLQEILAGFLGKERGNG